MKRKPLIYASCATARDPIHINVFHNDGEGTFNRYDLDPFKALTLAADLIQFYKWKAKEGLTDDLTNGNVHTKDRVDTSKRTTRSNKSKRNSY